MNKLQRIQYAVFAAELVIDFYNDQYPDDDRPQKAINAAKNYLKCPSRKTKKAAHTAADAAADAAADTTIEQMENRRPQHRRTHESYQDIWSLET